MRRVQYNRIKETCGVHDYGNDLLEPADSVVVETEHAHGGAQGELSWGTGNPTYDLTYHPNNESHILRGGSPDVARICACTADGERIAASAIGGPDTGITCSFRHRQGQVVRRFMESGGNSQVPTYIHCPTEKYTNMEAWRRPGMNRSLGKCVLVS
ncbi:MAG TPA: hypothetical protein ENK19_06340, partial [Acidobacteria bacterium]|nr:hypothetical protein [Acidobacteriota bacterium]